MTGADQNRIERRSGQRFPYQLPVLLRTPGEGRSGAGRTQDLSSKGALVLTDFPLFEGQQVEMTLVMPAEITLAEDMKVCCHGRVVRRETAEDSKPAVAVRIERYDFIHSDAPILQQHNSREESLVRS